MSLFNETQPRLENHWRAVILFGRNVASYKFALAQSLLKLSQTGNEFVSLEELAQPFSQHICQHLQLVDKQGTFASSHFLDISRQYNAGESDLSRLLKTTEQYGFNNVLDAFHVVQNKPLDVRFFVDERKREHKGIRLTENLFKLSEEYQFRNLPGEVEARWRLVETAWQLSLPRHVLGVSYDSDSQMLFIPRSAFERTSVTSCRDALNGVNNGVKLYH